VEECGIEYLASEYFLNCIDIYLCLVSVYVSYVCGYVSAPHLHIESEYKVATLSDMRPTHTALRLRDMDTASRRQS